MWLKVEGIDAKNIVHLLSKKKVFLQSGGMFSTTDYYNDCFRINIGLAPHDEVLDQIKLLGDTIKQHD